MFCRFDKDGSGCLSVDEFLLSIRVREDTQNNFFVVEPLTGGGELPEPLRKKNFISSSRKSGQQKYKLLRSRRGATTKKKKKNYILFQDYWGILCFY